ncbi:Histone deacetylase hdt1, variant 2 [Lathyrus oleraceus]|uniref:Histone deacetylase hdt1, variant 2 n=2 Tax=Pisum sativum TaxID=3888 RepID=A0A9D4VRF7_PEA|nr:Histone deacetylase hdt1, variant 2 [Pisum sativum]
MDSPMEFWGVEAKVGQSVKVDPNDEFEGYIHISKVALGEFKKGKASEPVVVYVKVKDQKIVLGTLIKDEIPQISLDIVLEQESELSHNSKNAAVYFSGYKVFRPDDESEGSESSDSDEELAPLKENVKVEADKSGKPTAEVDALTKQVKVVDPTNGKIVDPVKHEDESDDESDSDFSEDEISDDEIDSDSDESESEQDASPKSLDADTTGTDSDTDSEEETPAKVVTQGKNNKRGIGAGSQTPVPAKKAKKATPEKTDGKKGVHIATPHPTKQSGKFHQNAAKGQTPNSSKPGQQSKKSKQGRRFSKLWKLRSLLESHVLKFCQHC